MSLGIPFFRRVRKIAKTIVSSVMSVRLFFNAHGTPRLPLGGFLKKFDWGILRRSCEFEV
jgi:hypothetical protein